MKLIIAEKPNLAKAIAEALPGKMETKKGYIECSQDIIVTWLVGHVLHLAEPEGYDINLKNWYTIINGPIVPVRWKLLVSPKVKQQVQIVTELHKKADQIIHAGDPDREGQLLVDEFLEYIGNKKPVLRFLGGNNLEPTAIRTAMTTMKDNRHYDSLRKSALARQRADWLIGMNLTRLFTLYMQSQGHEGVSNIGRVKTPVMCLIVERIAQIQNFKPVDFYSLRSRFSAKGQEFHANWQIPKDTPGLDPEGRLIDKATVETLLQKLNNNKVATITSFKAEDKKEQHPLCFNISALQIKANKQYGYKPDDVADTLQKLYEAKLLTYPGTDCPYLPEDQHGNAQDILSIISTFAPFTAIIAKTNTRIISRTWNSKKAPVHHAIIPTKTKFDFNTLSQKEKNLYTMVAMQYIMQFYDLHNFKQTEIEIDHAGEKFNAVGKVTVKAGWRELFGKDDQDEKDEDSQSLPVVAQGDKVNVVKNEINQKTTKPPKPFTLGSILEAMENIHKYVKNPEAKKILKDVKGIGTARTSGTILKDLTKDIIEVYGKKEELHPSPKAVALYRILPAELKYPDTTAVWEMSFNQIVETNSDIDPFIANQVKLITKLIDQYKGAIKPRVVKQAPAPDKNAETCPECKKGKLVLRTGSKGNFYGCNNFPKCKFTKTATPAPKAKSDFPIM